MKVSSREIAVFFVIALFTFIIVIGNDGLSRSRGAQPVMYNSRSWPMFNGDQVAFAYPSGAVVDTLSGSHVRIQNYVGDDLPKKSDEFRISLTPLSVGHPTCSAYAPNGSMMTIGDRYVRLGELGMTSDTSAQYLYCLEPAQNGTTGVLLYIDTGDLTGRLAREVLESVAVQ